MTIHQALQYGAKALAAVPDPKIDAAALLCHVTGLPRIELLLRAAEPLQAEQETAYRTLLERRAQREPLQYMLGAQCFFGLDFHVDKRVLIPRSETETLCELALQRISPMGSSQVLDVCTGSGAIAVVLKHERPNAQVFATDLSRDALTIAAENANRNAVSVHFAQGDLFAPVSGKRFDCIVSNPPYICSDDCPTLQPEVLQEPLMALDGGADGLDFYRRIITEAPLRANGWLCLEIGDTQGAAVRAMLNADGRYDEIAIHQDLYGLDRVALAHAAAFPT